MNCNFSLKAAALLAAGIFALGLMATSANAVIVGELGILDDTANGGTNPGTSAAWAPGDEYRLVFATSATTLATSTNIATYDTFVQGLADTANLGGTWQVLGSTAAVNAKDHTSSNENIDPSEIPVVLIDGTSIVAKNYAQLWYSDGDPISGINKDENGNASAGLAFTGNDRYGVKWSTHALGDSTVGKGYTGVPDWRLFGAGSWGGNNVDVPPSIGWLPNTQERPIYAMSEVLAIPTNAPHPGDANGDGWVDVSDLGILATNWQQFPRTFSEGNFNEPIDDIVNVSDLGILATNWQTGPNPPSQLASAVPEPTSLVLLSLSSLVLLTRRRS